MKIKVHVECCHIGHEQKCGQSFESTIAVCDIHATVEGGGQVDLQWPDPPAPEGWRSYGTSFYCPSHVPSWLPKQ